MNLSRRHLLMSALLAALAGSCSGSEEPLEADLRLTTPGVFVALVESDGYRIFRVLSATAANLRVNEYEEIASNFEDAARLAQSRQLHVAFGDILIPIDIFTSNNYRIVWYRSLPGD
jgi:hypothetical protein